MDFSQKRNWLGWVESVRVKTLGFWSLHGTYQRVESKRRLPTNIGRFNESFDLETGLAT